jgi:hypothetical protein
MLKQKARAVAMGVLAGDLALTALSLPIAYVLRQGALPASNLRLISDEALTRLFSVPI